METNCQPYRIIKQINKDRENRPPKSIQNEENKYTKKQKTDGITGKIQREREKGTFWKIKRNAHRIK